jgi:hypothetical protein
VEHGTRWQPSPWRWLFDGIFKTIAEQLIAIPMELQNVPNGGGVEGRISHLKFCDFMSIGGHWICHGTLASTASQAGSGQASHKQPLLPRAFVHTAA